MILAKRTVYSLLLALVCADLVFRYPLDVPHELGADTTFIHTLATSIAVEGRASWIVHPTSYFGLYALSYPSAIPFYFAAGTILTGIPVEGIMLILGWVTSVVGVLGAFLVARKLRRDDIFALTVATLLAFSPFFVKDTFWVGSTRGFVVSLVPVFLLLAIGSLRTHQLRQVALAFVLFIVLAAIHRMGFLVFFVIVAYMFAVPFHKLTQRLRFALYKYERVARYAFVLTTMGSFIGVFYVQFLYPGVGGADVAEQYGSGAFFHGDSFPVLLANMGVSLTGKVGPLFPVALVGLVAYTWRRPKEATDKFVLTTMLLFLPLLSLRDYMGEFLIPLFTILVVIGLVSARRFFPKRGKLVAIGLAVLVIASVGFSWEMKDYWRERYVTDAPIEDGTYDAAVYLRFSTDETIIANEGLGGGQLAAISGRPVLPIGGASQHWTGPQQIAWHFVDPGTVSVRLLEFGNVSFNSDEVYVPVGVRNAEIDWETIFFYREPAAADQQFLRYHIHYVVVLATLPDSFISYGLERPSPYLTTVLPTTSYVVYDNGAYRIWFRG